jgi:hypothetical protein
LATPIMRPFLPVMTPGGDALIDINSCPFHREID